MAASLYDDLELEELFVKSLAGPDDQNSKGSSLIVVVPPMAGCRSHRHGAEARFSELASMCRPQTRRASKVSNSSIF